jgi:uncharacterized protein involved in response to NO
MGRLSWPKGGLGPPLLPRGLAGRSDAALAAVILDGRPGTSMPPGRRPLGARAALFALGFRPVFLLAGLYGVGSMGLWLYSYVAGRPLDTYYGVYAWHAHGMLFGYAVAVIAGFLLTAVRNWTQTLSGVPLAALWLVGRLTPFFPQVIAPP